MFLAQRRHVFVDTGAWRAVVMASDAYHSLARAAWERLLAVGRPLITTNLVVGEAYTLLRTRQGYEAAWAFLSLIDRSQRLTRHFITPELETQAYAILRQYRDHDFSFVDATSFAFMRSAGITEAFAFDAHFAAAGFTRIPVDQPVE